MSDFEPLRVAVIGCGNISGAYGSSLKTKPELVQIIGAFDIMTDQAKAFVNNYGGHVYEKLEDVMADPEVELVINLTSHHAHAEVSFMALVAGKHAHSENLWQQSVKMVRNCLNWQRNIKLDYPAHHSHFLVNHSRPFGR